MKIQNHILNIERTDARTDKPKAICPFNFLKGGEHRPVHLQDVNCVINTCFCRLKTWLLIVCDTCILCNNYCYLVS